VVERCKAVHDHVEVLNVVPTRFGARLPLDTFLAQYNKPSELDFGHLKLASVPRIIPGTFLDHLCHLLCYAA
jgi:hypothetical protein